MSIEFSPAFDRRTRSQRVSSPSDEKRRAKTRTGASARRIAANRRNAQRSTGPRTAAGKQRASRNALKHGLCSRYACLDGECAATYATYVRELEEELQPRTTLQRALLPHIANLLWRIDRLPQAQADMFQLELRKCGKRKILTAAQVLARRFSDEPTSNGFLLIGRYERTLHNQLHRLMSRYEWLKKNRPTMPIDEDELRAAQRRKDDEVDAYVEECARRTNAERAAEEARAAAQEAARETALDAARREAVHQDAAPREPVMTEPAQHGSAAPQSDDILAAKRTQLNPPPIAISATEPGKCAKNDAAQGAKRTHHAPAPSSAQSCPPRTPPPTCNDSRATM